jgi:hypothetical protein
MLKVIAALALVVAVGVATYALAGGNDDHAKPGRHGKQAQRGEQGREGHGPPPWAPAYGFRCKQAGNAPGSQAFKDCIKAKKQ